MLKRRLAQCLRDAAFTQDPFRTPPPLPSFTLRLDEPVCGPTARRRQSGAVPLTGMMKRMLPRAFVVEKRLFG